MKSEKSESVEARYHKLEAVVGRVFDFPTMVKFSVGPSWSSMSPAQQEALTGAFQRLTAASYAKNFVGYSGQRFEVSPNVVTRGPDKVVQTQLISPGQAPTPIAYRMRDNGGGWKIIDVNPRVGASAGMIAAVGLDFAAANLADFWGEPTEALLPPLRGEHYVVRQFANYVTSP
jgi:phospholipid transport system substrate-binding protein